MVMLRCDGSWIFRRFDAMPVNCTTHVMSENKTREKTFDDILRNSGSRRILAMKLISPQVFDTPYACCTEKVPYVRRAAVLLDKVLHDWKLPNEPREPSFQWVLLDRALSNVNFVRRALLFGRDNNIVRRARSECGIYCGWVEFSTVYGLTQSQRASFWPNDSGGDGRP